jgi:hypothetical protein
LLKVLRDSFAVFIPESKKLDPHVDSGLDVGHHTLALDRTPWRDGRKIEADDNLGLGLEGVSG